MLLLVVVQVNAKAISISSDGGNPVYAAEISNTINNFQTSSNVTNLNGCPVNGVLRITKQEQIDNFATDYPNCTTLTALFISGTQVQNLTGLAQINTIDPKKTGFGRSIVEIKNTTQLHSLSGLQAAIVGDFVLENNAGLTDLIGFDGSAITGKVMIKSNENLNSIEDLSGGFTQLSVVNNAKLQKCGMSNVYIGSLSSMSFSANAVECIPSFMASCAKSWQCLFKSNPKS